MVFSYQLRSNHKKWQVYQTSQAVLWAAQSDSPMVAAVLFTTAMTYTTGREQRTERRGGTGVHFFRALVAAGGTAHSLGLVTICTPFNILILPAQQSGLAVLTCRGKDKGG